MYSPEFVQNWLKTALLFSVEDISGEVFRIYTTASITTWTIQCILHICNFVENTRMQEVLNTLKDRFHCGLFSFPVFIIVNRLFCKIMYFRVKYRVPR